MPTAIPALTPSPRSSVLLILARWSVVDANLDLVLATEVGPILRALGAANFRPAVASEAGKPIVGATFKLVPDLRLRDVKLADYAGVLVPCAGGGNGLVARDAIAILKSAAARRMLIGAQHSGIDLLILADLIKPGSLAKGYPVGVAMQSDRIILSGGCPLSPVYDDRPDSTLEFAERSVEALKAAA